MNNQKPKFSIRRFRPVCVRACVLVCRQQVDGLTGWQVGVNLSICACSRGFCLFAIVHARACMHMRMCKLPGKYASLRAERARNQRCARARVRVRLCGRCTHPSRAAASMIGRLFYAGPGVSFCKVASHAMFRALPSVSGLCPRPSSPANAHFAEWPPFMEADTQAALQKRSKNTASWPLRAGLDVGGTPEDPGACKRIC